jgi:hypothetical protein
LCLTLNTDRFIQSGTVQLTVARFDDGTKHQVDVPLGGPFPNRTPGTGREIFVGKAVADAVVAYSEFQPAEGRRARIVGLR